jgi:hypothetical protein
LVLYLGVRGELPLRAHPLRWLGPNVGIVYEQPRRGDMVIATEPKRTIGKLQRSDMGACAVVGAPAAMPPRWGLGGS